jgi:hypothetical protein
VDDARPAVVGVIAALDHTFSFQAVDGGGDGAAGELHLAADLVHRSRTFVQEHLEREEVGESDAQRSDVTVGVLPHRLVRLHQDQPQANTAHSLIR